MEWGEGQDGGQVHFRERLRPPVLVFVVAIGMSAVVGVAYAAAYGPALGWAMGGALTIVALTVLVATSTPVRVDDRVVRAGRARLPLTAIGGVRVLDPDEMVQARRHGDPRDYVVLRAWSSRTGVAIEVQDERDPHPRWIVSSRHPDRMAAAIAAARDEDTGSMRGAGQPPPR